jgi:hypothetical protein
MLHSVLIIIVTLQPLLPLLSSTPPPPPPSSSSPLLFRSVYQLDSRHQSWSSVTAAGGCRGRAGDVHVLPDQDGHVYCCTAGVAVSGMCSGHSAAAAGNGGGRVVEGRKRSEGRFDCDISIFIRVRAAAAALWMMVLLHYDDRQ